MTKANAQTHLLPWWAAGILLGLVQVLAVSLAQSLDISSQFVSTNIGIFESVAPAYLENHPLMEKEEYKKSDTENEEYQKPKTGWWFGIGILIGALIAAVHLKIWKIRTTSQLWQEAHNTPIIVRMIIGFFGGFLILLGSAIAYGSVSGHFFSGLSQLSLAAVPFTISMLVSGMFIAYMLYPKTTGEVNQEK